MPLMIEFHIPIVPKAQKRARHGRLPNGRSVTYKDAGQRSAENDLISLMRPHVPEQPMEHGVAIEIAAVFPVPDSWSKKKKEQPGAMLSKPDIDNSIKFVLDCMTTLRFWADDKQVVSIRAQKMYEQAGSPSVGWHIRLR